MNKRLIGFIGAVLGCALAAISCGDNDLPHYSGHFLEHVNMLDDNSMSAPDWVITPSRFGLLYWGYPINLQVSFTSHPCTPDQYENLWTYYGDTACFRERLFVDGNQQVLPFHLFLDARFSALEVKALSDYDDAHPAGSSLSDICYFRTHIIEIRDWIESNYSNRPPLPCEAIRIDQISPGVVEMLPIFSDEDGFSLLFSKVPSQQCEVEITLRNEFGQVFTFRAKVAP